MDPAYSVILFTSSSGAGYGLMIWLAIARLSGAWELTITITVDGKTDIVIVTATL